MRSGVQCDPCDPRADAASLICALLVTRRKAGLKKSDIFKFIETVKYSTFQWKIYLKVHSNRLKTHFSLIIQLKFPV